jgi:hypothetical protein
MSEETMEFDWNSGGQEPMDFSPIKPGKYPLCIVGVALKTTTKGDKMIETHLVIDEGELKGRQLWNRVTFISDGKPGAGIAIHFLKTIGQPFETDKNFKVQPQNWVGRRFIGTIANESYTPPSGDTRINNVVKGVEPVAAGSPITNLPLAQKFVKKVEGEEVPF